ncbi:MAG: tetratricopeptide repeat protein [Proteobacteria bacterium]|nr:tetratricopeptide repeat protein [Pseudomonadota bacterium]MBU1595594.1 tetratricopeptide repeat protein [Pseudomonadota bacterium]
MSPADFWVVVAAILTATIGLVNRHRIQRFFQRNFSPLRLPASDGFTVLVADLERDPDCTRTNHLVEALGKLGGFHVRTTATVLTCAPVAGDLAGAQARLRDRAQALLRENSADVLVWGRHYENTFQLGFVARQGDAQAEAGLTGYDIKPDFTLPNELTAGLRALLELTILTSIRPATKETGTYLVDKIRPLVLRLEAYLIGTENVKGATDLTEEQLATAWHSLGLAYSTLGQQAGDNDALGQALDAYHKALAHISREAQAKTWARTQGNLAVALRTLGERENSTTRLEEAAGVYREILGVFTQEAAPLAWATTQNNLGNALAILGERESGTERLEQAVQAYAEALKEYTRQRAPLSWATTQNNLGTALWSLAEKSQDPAQAREALKHYEAAHGVFSQAAPYYREVVEGNMRKVQAFIDKLEKGR